MDSFMEMSNGSEILFHLAPEEVLAYNGIQPLWDVYEWAGVHWTEDKAQMSCAPV